MKKRILSALLASAMLFALAACGNNQRSEERRVGKECAI